MFVSMSWRFWTHSTTPQLDKSSPEWCSTQAVEGQSTTTRRSDERGILGLLFFQYLCATMLYVGYLLCWIFVMFDMCNNSFDDM
jgi:hypothetical protein